MKLTAKQIGRLVDETIDRACDLIERDAHSSLTDGAWERAREVFGAGLERELSLVEFSPDDFEPLVTRSAETVGSVSALTHRDSGGRHELDT